MLAFVRIAILSHARIGQFLLLPLREVMVVDGDVVGEECDSCWLASEHSSSKRRRFEGRCGWLTCGSGVQDEGGDVLRFVVEGGTITFFGVLVPRGIGCRVAGWWQESLNI